MKKLILMILLISSYCFSQESKLDISMLQENNDLRAGTCASPDGITRSIPSPPANYQYLQDNGYCYPISPAVKDLIVCYTMTAGATSVSFNAGYNASGCSGLNINYARLYTSGACVLVNGAALGTVSGLTIGTNYTWCISLKCTGPGPGFSSFCPYYQNITPLPVELTEFKCITENDDIQLKWITASETNNSHFDILRANNSLIFNKIGMILGNQTTSEKHYYQFIDLFPELGDNYYMLEQVDNNGDSNKSFMINCFYENKKCVITYYNLLGQLVDIKQANSGMYLRMMINGDHYKIEKYWKL